MSTPRRSKTLTFSLSPEMEAQVRQVMKEDDLSVSELLRRGQPQGAVSEVVDQARGGVALYRVSVQS